MSNAKSEFFNCVLVPFFPRFAANFLQYFSMATKKKKKKGSARIYRQAANVSPHTYARGFVRQTFIYLFIYLFVYLFIFLNLRYNLNIYYVGL